MLRFASAAPAHRGERRDTRARGDKEHRGGRGSWQGSGQRTQRNERRHRGQREERTEQPDEPEKPQEPQDTVINPGAAAASSTAAAIAAAAHNAAIASVATAANILSSRFPREARTSTSKLELPTHTSNVRRAFSKTNNC